MIRVASTVLVALLMAAPAAAQTPAGPRRQVEVDAYTRYELLAPGTGKFRIVYEVTDATPGATAYFNPIRKGSIATDERVSDRATGRPLKFDVVSGEEARRTGLPEASLDTDYIRVQLARPIPAPEGQARVLIEKTYEDSKSYFRQGEAIVFDRPLGIKRNAVVLPPGYELVSCNVPSQVRREADGRIAISFLNDGPGQAPLVLRARPARLPLPAAPPLEDRAHQSRDIVYFLKAPETHAFELYHDYTETRAGVGRYVNVVRTGSHASSPSGVILDTGEPLGVQVLRGQAIARAGVRDEGLPKVTADSEVVLFSFRPLRPGESARLRMRETYADPKGYRLDGDRLVFDRTFGRPANAVVLPAGWALTGSSMPAAVTTTDDGRVRLDFLNPRPDELHVVITAGRKLAAQPGS
jgi:hypothetical protein